MVTDDPGLPIDPGIEMADVLAFNLTNPDKQPKSFTRPDLSTKLKPHSPTA
jgi:nitrite reductase (NAD(P)H)